MLADLGYDVWLGNIRGTVYSHDSTFANYLTDTAYWNFSIHEQGAYDVHAFVNHIKTETKQKVIYIGHSLGTTASFVYQAVRTKEANENLKVAILMAPVMYIRNTRMVYRYLFRFWPIYAVSVNTFV